MKTNRSRVVLTFVSIVVVVAISSLYFKNKSSQPNWNESLIINLLGDEAWKIHLVKLSPQLRRDPKAMEKDRELFLARGLSRVMHDAASEQIQYTNLPSELKDVVRELLTTSIGFEEDELRGATISVNILPWGTSAIVIQNGAKRCEIETHDYGY